MTKAMPLKRKCAACTRPALRSARYCEVCATLCIKCHAEPRIGKSAYCRTHRNETMQAYRKASVQNKQLAKLRHALTRALRKGTVTRTPCAICERLPSYAYFPNMTIETVVFLCREHRGQVG